MMDEKTFKEEVKKLLVRPNNILATVDFGMPEDVKREMILQFIRELKRMLDEAEKIVEDKSDTNGALYFIAVEIALKKFADKQRREIGRVIRAVQEMMQRSLKSGNLSVFCYNAIETSKKNADSKKSKCEWCYIKRSSNPDLCSHLDKIKDQITYPVLKDGDKKTVLELEFQLGGL